MPRKATPRACSVFGRYHGSWSGLSHTRLTPWNGVVFCGVFLPHPLFSTKVTLDRYSLLSYFLFNTWALNGALHLSASGKVTLFFLPLDPGYQYLGSEDIGVTFGHLLGRLYTHRQGPGAPCWQRSLKHATKLLDKPMSHPRWSWSGHGQKFLYFLGHCPRGTKSLK